MRSDGFDYRAVAGGLTLAALAGAALLLAMTEFDWHGRLHADRIASVEGQISTLTCWAPDGKVALREEGLGWNDMEIRERDFRVYRGGRLVASVFYAMPCTFVAQAPGGPG